MDFLLWAGGAYLAVGFFKASDHVGSGKMGTRGPLATFVAVMLLWPDSGIKPFTSLMTPKKAPNASSVNCGSVSTVGLIKNI